MSQYRPNVGIVVFNAQAEVLQGERVDLPNAWQFPQGGIDGEESPLTAAQRELFEEVGIREAELVYEYPEWLSYDYPPEVQEKFRTAGKRYFKGQTQRWFLFFWDQSATNCNLEHDREFRAVRFVPLADCLATIPPFKLAVYQPVMTLFGEQIRKYLHL
jgi:putative (di)nucleoside polyphosphate hydrolase